MAKGTRTLTGGDGVRYRFDPGSLALELLLTGGPGPYSRFEIFFAPTNFVDWLVESRLALTAPLTTGGVRIRPAELTAIKTLRDTFWRIATNLAHDRPLVPADLSTVNDAAATTLRPRIDLETGSFEWVVPITGPQVLGVIAREIVELVVAERGPRVRECSASDCQLLFLDTSRSGNRRWCSMERCGNRNKVRSYRARQDTL
jgi:predicted RNA-binding Zn ribbon-like protein